MEQVMEAGTIYIIGTIIATGAAVLGFILPDLRSLKREMGEVHRDISDLRERMARLEGLFEGFTRRGQEDAP